MAKRIECFYGQTGTGKSEAVASVIEQIYLQSGLSSRVIIGDGSRATYVDRGLVDEGIVQILDFSIRDWPTTVLAQLCMGYWPADVDDPKSPLLPPQPGDLLKLGVFAVEGLSVGSQYLMGDRKGGYAERASKGIKIGQDSPVFLVDAELDKNGNAIANTGPGNTYGGNPMSHYGFVQRRMLTNVESTKVFPGVVIWTAHERAAQDRVSGEKMIGPEAGGEALTTSLPRYFNNTLHFASVAKGNTVKDDHTEKMVKELDVEYRIYTRDHYNADPTSPTMTKYKVVTRGTRPEVVDGKGKVIEPGMPLYLTNSDPGAAVLEFYKRLADRNGGRAAALKAAREARVRDAEKPAA